MAMVSVGDREIKNGIRTIASCKIFLMIFPENFIYCIQLQILTYTIMTIELLSNSMIQNEEVITVAFLGEQTVGKTSFVHKFFKSETLRDHKPTIAVETSYSSYQCVDGTVTGIKYWDTTGDPRYKNMVCFHLRSTDIMVLIYDITSFESFSKLKEWIKRMQQNKVHPCVLILIGNKTDLVEEEPSIRMVSKKQGYDFAQQILAKFYEISVLNSPSMAFLENCFEQVLSIRAEKAIEQKKQTLNLDDDILLEKKSQKSVCQCTVF